jgi:hypothetical protein
VVVIAKVAMTKLDRKDPVHWIPRDLYEAYLGEGSDPLLAHYDKAKAKRNPITLSFDLFAILAFPAWLGYRGQWLLWMVFVGMFALLSFVEHLTATEFPASGFVGVGVAMGLMARGFLLTSATGRYTKLKSQGLDDEGIRARLQDQARRNPALAVAGGVGALVVLVGADLLASVIFA